MCKIVACDNTGFKFLFLATSYMGRTFLGVGVSGPVIFVSVASWLPIRYLGSIRPFVLWLQYHSKATHPPKPRGGDDTVDNIRSEKGHCQPAILKIPWHLRHRTLDKKKSLSPPFLWAWLTVIFRSIFNWAPIPRTFILHTTPSIWSWLRTSDLIRGVCR